MPLAGTSSCCNWPNELHADRIYLEVTRDADRPGQIASRELLAERRARSVTGIRQHTAEAHASRHRPINLSQRDLGLGPCHPILGRNARLLQPSPIICPVLGKEKAQRHHHRHFAARKGQRHQRLAVGRLAQGGCILLSHAELIWESLIAYPWSESAKVVTLLWQIFFSASSVFDSMGTAEAAIEA